MLLLISRKLCISLYHHRKRKINFCTHPIVCLYIKWISIKMLFFKT